MAEISLLIGSGFSIPFGYSSTAQLNKKLGFINADEISIHTSGGARFLSGEEDPNNWWMRPDIKKSKILIIIGYGFGDKQINSFIEEFIVNNNKKIFIVDIKSQILFF